MSCAFLAASGLGARLELEIAQFLGMERGPRPDVALALDEQMPDHDSKFASSRNGRHVLAAPGPDTEEEGAQWAWCPRRRPGRLDQHAAGVAAPLLGDPPMIRRSGSRLPDARVQAEIADKLVRRIEAGPARPPHSAGRRP